MYCVYALIDVRTGLPFYIGKGKLGNDRPLDHFLETVEHNSNRHKVFKIQHLTKIGLTIPIQILSDNIEIENDAYDIETAFIKFYGRKNIDPNGVLTNILLDSRIRPNATGKMQSPEHVAKRVASRKKTAEKNGGYPLRSEAAKKATSEKLKGENNPFYGKTHSPQFCVEQSARMKGNNFNGKQVTFVSPDGTRFIVIGIAKFCRDHGLSIASIEKGMYKGIWPTRGKNVGWRVII